MNPFDGKFKAFATALRAKNAQDHADDTGGKSAEVFRDKPFTEEYRTLYTVAAVGQLLSQVVTYLTTAGLGVFALVHVIPLAWGIYVAVPLALAFAFGVERVKRSSLAIAAKHVLKYRTFGFVGIAAGLVMCVSIAAALYGAKELPGVVYPVPKRVADPAAVAALTADIDRIQSDIDRLQAGLKSEANWTAENRTLPKLQAQRAALVERRDAATSAAEGRADAGHAEALSDRAAKVDKMQVYSIAAAVVAELVFLLCTAFVFYYLFRHYAESNPAQEDEKKAPAATAAPVGFSANGTTTTTTTAPNGTHAGPTNEARRPIGFFQYNANRNTQNVDGNKRSCAHCGQAYVYGHARQKYCSEDCRVAAWELRAGRPLQKQRSSV